MPVLGGKAAVKLIRSDIKRINEKTPILACSAHVLSSEEKERLLSFGFTDFITKPVSFSELEKYIAKYKKTE